MSATRLNYVLLVVDAWLRLLEYDWQRRLHLSYMAANAPVDPRRNVPESALLEAALLACKLYWRPVGCLQRSVATVRLLRAHGVPAKLVVGLRVEPFQSHAWVQIDGRVVNESSVYALRMQVLYGS